MRCASLHLATTLLAVVTGCSGTPEAGRVDVDFARGCWAAKDEPGGRVIALLRLLPDRRDGTTLTGYLSVMFDDPSISALKTSTEFVLERDGSTLTIAPAGETARTLRRTIPPHTTFGALHAGEFEAGYAASETTGWTVLTGGAETLTIYTISPGDSGGEVLFNGERDGCD